MTEYIKNVAIVGGSGRIGTAILNALLATNCFNITAISRANSKPTFPSTVTVKKGHYSNSDFLVSVLQGQDAFIYVLGIGTPYETAMALADAAIAAKVPWVLPNEYGSDNLHPLMGGGQGFVVRDKVDGFEKLQNSDCNVVAYVNGCWYDYVSTSLCNTPDKSTTDNGVSLLAQDRGASMSAPEKPRSMATATSKLARRPWLPLAKVLQIYCPCLSLLRTTRHAYPTTKTSNASSQVCGSRNVISWTLCSERRAQATRIGHSIRGQWTTLLPRGMKG